MPWVGGDKLTQKQKDEALGYLNQGREKYLVENNPSTIMRTISEEKFQSLKDEMQRIYPGCEVNILYKKSGKVTVGITIPKEQVLDDEPFKNSK